MRKKPHITICTVIVAALLGLSAFPAYAVNENSGTYRDSSEPGYSFNDYDTYEAELRHEPQEDAIPAARIVNADTGWFDSDHQKEEYEISTEAELMGLAQLVNSRKMENGINEVHTFQNIVINLTEDIVLTNSWVPIGSSEDYAFEGRLEGNGHTITNLKIQNAMTSDLGLFGYLKGSVNNLNVVGEITAEGNNIGGIAGQLAPEALIENVAASVSITGESRLGGIAGINNCGKIINCHASGDLKGLVKIGGITGENWGGIIKNCSNEGNITSEGKGVGTYGSGGIAGRSVSQTARITGCFNTGTVNSENECTGGIVGYSNSRGSVIQNCYNTGSIHCGAGSKATYGALGGIAGVVGIDGVVVRNNYNIGYLKGGKFTGGVVGEYIADHHASAADHISNNYYADGVATAGIGRVQGDAGKNCSGVAESRSPAELRSPGMPAALGSAYTADSSSMYWQNAGYPLLLWQGEDNTKKEAILDEMKIHLKKEFTKLFAEHGYGAISGDWVMKTLHPDFIVEQCMEEVQKREAKELKDKRK